MQRLENRENLLSILLLLFLSPAYYCDGQDLSAQQRVGLDFTIQVCNRQGICLPEPVGLVMDYSYFCDDPKTCYEASTYILY